MKTKQTIRDSRDANDEQASAQHTPNKQQNTKIDGSVAESFVVRASGASVCVCTLSSLSFCSLHAKAPTLCTLFFLLFSLSLSLSLSFGAEKTKKNKKKPPTPFVIIVPAL
jgi:ABC-type nickel/cobalt efflux system permease component RcnA